MAVSAVYLFTEAGDGETAQRSGRGRIDHHAHLGAQKAVRMEIDETVWAETARIGFENCTSGVERIRSCFVKIDEVVFSDKLFESGLKKRRISHAERRDVTAFENRRIVAENVTVDPFTGVVSGVEIICCSADMFEADAFELAVDVGLQACKGLVLPVGRQVKMDHLPCGVDSGVCTSAAGHGAFDSNGFQGVFDSACDCAVRTVLSLESFKFRSVIRYYRFYPHRFFPRNVS